jgi:hypothetical protein
MVLELETPESHEDEDEGSEFESSEIDSPFEDDLDADGLTMMGQLEDHADPGIPMEPEEQAVIIADPTDPEGGDLEVTLRPVEEELESGPMEDTDLGMEEEVKEPEPEPEPDESELHFAVFSYDNGRRNPDPVDQFRAASMAHALRRIANFGVRGEIRSTQEAAHREAVIVLDAASKQYLGIIASSDPFEVEINCQQPAAMPKVPDDGGQALRSEKMARNLSSDDIVRICADNGITPESVEQRILDGESLKIAGWSLSVNDDADVELRFEDGAPRVASLGQLDTAIKTFMTHVAHELPTEAASFTISERFAVRCASCTSITEYIMPNKALDIDCGACGVPTPASKIAESFSEGDPITGYQILSSVPASADDRTRELNAKRILSAIQQIIPTAVGGLRHDAKLAIDIDGNDQAAMNRVRRILEDRYGVQEYEFRQAQLMIADPQAGPGPMPDIGGPEMGMADGSGDAAAPAVDQINQAVMSQDIEPGDKLSGEEIEAVRAALTHYRNQGVGPMVALDQLSSQYKDLFNRYGEKEERNRHMVEAEAMRIAAEVWTRSAILPSAGEPITMAAKMEPGKINTQQPDAVSVESDLGPDSSTEDLLPEPKINTQTPPGGSMSDTSMNQTPGDAAFSVPKPKTQHPATDQKGTSLGDTNMGKDQTCSETKNTRKWDSVSSNAGSQSK